MKLPMLSFRESLLLSVFIHLLVIMQFLRFNELEREKEESRKQKIALNKSIMEFIMVDEIVNNEKAQENDLYFHKKQNRVNECKDYYVGIGINVSIVIHKDQFWLLVTRVYKGYPAERYGILEGDFIFEKEEIKAGFIGDPVDLIIERNGTAFEISIPRGKICTD